MSPVLPHRPLIRMGLAVMIAVGVIAALAEPQAQAPAPLKFDVVSIKPGDADGRSQVRGCGYRCYAIDNDTVLTALLTAFDFDEARMVNVPAWVKTELYSIDAKPPDDLPPASAMQQRQQMQAMLQGMLADRFQLVVHREQRVVPVYELVVAKSGSKFPPVPRPGQPSPRVGPVNPNNPDLPLRPGPGEVGGGVSGFANLPGFLGKRVGRPVIDKTGITGNYEISLVWKPVTTEATEQPDTSAPGIFTALEEQLGLHLQAATGSVEYLVIDHIARPTPN